MIGRKTRKSISIILMLVILLCPVCYAEDSSSNQLAAEELNDDILKGGSAPNSKPEDSKSALDIISVVDISSSVSEANTKYSYILFSFSSSAEDAIYECYVTGLEIDEASRYSEDTRTSYEKLCSDIAKSYYEGRSFDISDGKSFADEYNLNISPIDAEKENIWFKCWPEDGWEDGDSGLCWGSSASNMLEYSTWAQQAGFEDEDEVFSYITDRFYNMGSSASNGLKWFFDGVNRNQVTGENGEIYYDPSTIVAVVREPVSPSTVADDGVLKDYAYETVSVTKNTVEPDTTDTVDELSQDVLKLKDGYVLGIGHHGHAETLFGYIVDKLSDGINALRAVFLANSDDNAYNYENPDDRPVGATDKKDRENHLTMYVNDLNSEAEEKQFDFTNWVILEPYSSEISKETEGTKNAQNTIDVVPESVMTYTDRYEDTVHTQPGKEVSLSIKITNASYANIDITGDPHIKGNCVVFLDDERIEELPFDIALDEMMCGANCTYTMDTGTLFKPKKSGTYTVCCTIDGVYLDAEKIQEAYVLNNTSTKCLTVKVEDTDASTVYIPSKYSISYSLTCGGNCTVAFNATAKEFGGLYYNGRLIDNSLYKIADLYDGTYELSLSEDFLKTLLRGVNELVLKDSVGNTIAVFELNITF